MSDSRSDYDEQLPWLEAVDDEDGPPGVSARKMLAALVVVLLAGVLVAASFYWLGRQNAGGAPQLIRAEPSPYKVRPENPGGLDVAGESETAFETSAGEDVDARLDMEAMPEEAIARPEPPVSRSLPPNETREPVAEPSAPVAAAEPRAGGSGSVIQLGAFRTAAQSQRAWDALSARFAMLSGMTKIIIPYSGGYRLRAGAASPDEARRVCQALKVAGESCFIAN